MEAGRDLYGIMGVDPSATDAEIKKAYRKLAMKHHPDRRQSSPHASESAFQEISNAYKILSDPRKRRVYDMGGADALEQDEGMEQMGFDQLLLTILMWEPKQKMAFSCILLLIAADLCAAVLLITLKLDMTIGLSWMWTLCPLWIPAMLCVPILVLAPCAIYAQAMAAGGEEAAMMQAKAGCVGCIVASMFAGVLFWAGWMLTERLDGQLGSSYLSAAMPIIGIEAVVGLAYAGAPAQQAVRGLLWKLLRVVFLVLVALKLDGPGGWGGGAWVTWPIALAPLQVGAVLAVASLGWEVADHQGRVGQAMGRDNTYNDEGVSQYAHFFFGLRACVLLGFVISVVLLSLMMEQDFAFGMTTIAAPFLASIALAYAVVCCALFMGNPPDASGGYTSFDDSGSYTP